MLCMQSAMWLIQVHGVMQMSMLFILLFFHCYSYMLFKTQIYILIFTIVCSGLCAFYLLFAFVFMLFIFIVFVHVLMLSILLFFIITFKTRRTVLIIDLYLQNDHCLVSFMSRPFAVDWMLISLYQFIIFHRIRLHICENYLLQRHMTPQEYFRYVNT